MPIVVCPVSPVSPGVVPWTVTDDASVLGGLGVDQGQQERRCRAATAVSWRGVA